MSIQLNRVLGIAACFASVLVGVPSLRPAVAAPALVERVASPTASHYPHNSQAESPMAVNPLNPLNAVSGANDFFAEPDCTPPSGGSSECKLDLGTNITGAYTTFDGGTTWQHQLLDWRSAGFVSDTDPGVAFGPRPDGSGRFSWANGARAYFSSDAHDPSIPFGVTTCQTDEAVGVASSDDGGATWNPPAIVSDGTSFNDKPSVWADNNPSSPYFGNVYLIWTRFCGDAPMAIARSTNGGATWDAPVNLTVNGFGGAVRADREGRVFAVWLGTSGRMLVAVSSDGGQHFSTPASIATVNYPPSPLPGASFRVAPLPTMDVDQSSDAIYVAWPDYVNGHGSIALASSTDHGASWSRRPNAVDVPRRTAFSPGLAAARNGAAPPATTTPGAVFIGANALDEVPVGTSPGSGVVFYDAYYATSYDGGASFSQPVRISARSSDPDVSTRAPLDRQLIGDYNAASAGTDGAFWFSWTDTRNGSTCPAVDNWRAGLAPKPNIYDSCSPGFGNDDIYVARVNR